MLQTPFSLKHLIEMKKHLLLIAVLLFVTCASPWAQIRLPRLLSSNMVLQQRSAVQLWGWSSPAEVIKITPSWSNATVSAVAGRDAKWTVWLQTPDAGGPYTILLEASNSILLENILIGEVWLLSGQSNMEWSAMNNNQQAMEEAPRASHPQIRLFHIPKTTASYPQDDCAATWKVCNPDDMKRFSAIGYFFGKMLQEELKVPIGLINASWGGTAAEVWTPREVVEKDIELLESARQLNAYPWWPRIPGAAYNAMIAPVTPFRIAGTLWYQGESNAGQSALYTRLFTSMIKSWRQEWGYPFPFYFVQIAPYTYDKPLIGALLREAQTESTQVPNTGMVVVSDLVDNVKDIHPQNKKDVAVRLARMALAKHYQKTSPPYRSPLYDKMTLENGKARIHFKYAENGLMSTGKEPSEFTIAGEDRIFYNASAKIEGSTVVVSSPDVKVPVAVRFGFSNASIPNLFSKEGLPVNLFRTDRWPN